MQEVVFPPGSEAGQHTHNVPGLRYVSGGTLTIEEQGKVTTYGPGSFYWREAGVPITRVKNTGDTPVRLFLMEFVPVDTK